MRRRSTRRAIELLVMPGRLRATALVGPWVLVAASALMPPLRFPSLALLLLGAVVLRGHAVACRIA